jgi:hypothetical protein
MAAHSALKTFSDEELEAELARRRRNQWDRFDRDRKKALGPNLDVATYMKLRYADTTRPFFKRYHDWYRREWEYQRGVGGEIWHSESEQAMPQLMLYRDEPLDGQLGILEWLTQAERVTMRVRLPGSQGESTVTGKYVHIFEHTLASSGGYVMFVRGDDNTDVLLLRSERWVEKMFADVMEALRYIQQHHFYEIKRRRE